MQLAPSRLEASSWFSFSIKIYFLIYLSKNFLFLAQQLLVARSSQLSTLQDTTQTQDAGQDSSGRVLSPTQKPLPENTQDSHPCPQRDSNPQSQQSRGGGPTPLTARPLALIIVTKIVLREIQISMLLKTSSRLDIFCMTFHSSPVVKN